MTVLYLSLEWSSLLALAEGKTVAIALASDVGTPGGTVFIPILVKGPAQLDVGAIVLELRLPSTLVKLRAIRPSFGTDIAAGKISSETAKAMEDDGGSVNLKIAIVSAKRLPLGVVATLELVIAEGVGNTRTIILDVNRVTLNRSDGKPTESVTRGKWRNHHFRTAVSNTSEC